MANYIYPESPAISNPELTQVSESYKKNVLFVLFSILVFILGYLLVFALSIVLVYVGAIAALAIITTHVNWITIILALGILMVVVMFFVYIVKFFFKFSSDEDPSHVEIFEKDHPKLFEFVAKVCQETKAPFPKKIVLSPRVNASVFYNSSFLSMFFPVRKNLEIGLGLVNSVNMSEFKAIIAHEFGHFSQSSTRIGSYVYRFHKMLHNLLYDNEGWESTLQSFSSTHVIISWFGRLTIFMVNGVIQFLLLLYKFINKNYMALSREMEFHADSVAVSVSGNSNIITALYRTDFSQGAYDYTLRSIYNYNTKDVRYPKNFFSLMTRNMLYLSRINDLKLQNNLPIINTEISNTYFLEDRVKYKDIWATHPPISEREKNANRIPVKSQVVDSSPWELFSNVEKLQEQLSLKLTELDAKTKQTVNNDEIISYMEKIEKEADFSSLYCDFYSYATATAFVPQTDNQEVLNTVSTWQLNDVFNATITHRVKRHNKNIYELSVLKAIKSGDIETKYFEFDNVKYHRDDAPLVMVKLQKDIDAESAWYESHKQAIANWFYVKAQAVNPALANVYVQLMKFRVKNIELQKPCLELMDKLVEFYHNELSKNITEDDLDWIRKKIGRFYDTYLSIVNTLTEEDIPAVLYEENILTTSYKDTVVTKVIANPLDSVHLDGYVPFTNAIEEFLQHWATLDHKVFCRTIKTQDEILKTIAQ